MTRHHESSEISRPASRALAHAELAGAAVPWFAAGWVLPVLAACAVVMTGHMLGVTWL